MSTNVPLPTIDDQGVNAPTSEAMFAGVMGDFAAAFGTAKMSTDAETPQGQLATAFTATLQGFVDFATAIVSRIDPATSRGRMQDAIGRFFNINRIGASYTLVTATCTGAVGTVIQQGSLAKTEGGEIYSALSAGEIGQGGTVDISFQCTVAGAIACPEGYLNTIYQGVSGWDTITNLSAGVVGTDEETAQAFEARRQLELTKNARGFNSSMKALLLDATDGPGCADAYVYDNSTLAPITQRGITIPVGAMYVCVSGGTDTSVAKAIWRRLSPGTAMVGSITVNVEDDANGYAAPLPSYAITFDRAETVPFKVSVQLSSQENVPGDIVSQVRAVVAAVFAGTDSTGRGAPRMGSRVLASRFYAPISALGPWADIVAVQIGTTAATEDYVDLDANQIGGVSNGDIAVVLV